ncbi:hypothetical protein G3L98_003978, partial [Salmonella enterica subsp. enterica serovar Takoradi]|nr:hypothetical protein [Salmonella enterica subsp. enterica serovar Takoradi]
MGYECWVTRCSTQPPGARVLSVGKAKRISASRFVSRLIPSYRLFFEDAGEGAAIFTFIIIRV